MTVSLPFLLIILEKKSKKGVRVIDWNRYAIFEISSDERGWVGCCSIKDEIIVQIFAQQAQPPSSPKQGELHWMDFAVKRAGENIFRFGQRVAADYRPDLSGKRKEAQALFWASLGWLL